MMNRIQQLLWRGLSGIFVLQSWISQLFRFSPVKDFSPKKAIIIATDRLGDLVMTTPLFRALKEAFPSIHITVVVSHAFDTLLEGNPDVDRIISYKRGGKRHVDLIRFMKKEQFDVAIHLLSRKLKFLSYAAQIPMRIGFLQKYPMRDRFFLTHIVPTTNLFQNLPKLFLKLLEPLGIISSSDQLKVALHPNDLTAAQKLLPSYYNQLIAIHPGTEDLFKQWPYFAELIELIVNKTSAMIVLTGNKQEISLGDQLSLISPRVINLMGKTPIRTLMGIYSLSHIVIGNDTGPLVVARALGVPKLTIYGPTHPSIIGDKDEGALTLEVPCRPQNAKLFQVPLEGYRFCANRSCKSKECLTQISAEQAFNQIMKILEK